MTHDELTPEEQLSRNVRELMRIRGWTQTRLAQELERSQSWVSKRLSGKSHPHGSRWQFEDLLVLARVFHLAPYELIRPGHGRFDRRQLLARRSGSDRRGRDEPPIDRTEDMSAAALRLKRPPGGRFLSVPEDLES